MLKLIDFLKKPNVASLIAIVIGGINCNPKWLAIFWTIYCISLSWVFLNMACKKNLKEVDVMAIYELGKINTQILFVVTLMNLIMAFVGGFKPGSIAAIIMGICVPLLVVKFAQYKADVIGVFRLNDLSLDDIKPLKGSFSQWVLLMLIAIVFHYFYYIGKINHTLISFLVLFALSSYSNVLIKIHHSLFKLVQFLLLAVLGLNIVHYYINVVANYSLDNPANTVFAFMGKWLIIAVGIGLASCIISIWFDNNYFYKQRLKIT